MIDIHTHILPFVDDGVRDFKEAMDIIENLNNQGVKHLFLTPHYYKARNYLNSYENNLEIFKELKQKVQDAGIDIQLYLGNEIKYTIDIFKYIDENKVVALNDSFYLIEFSTDASVYEITEAIHNMVAKGYRPIIAHIERYDALSKMEDIHLLKKIGALVQVNVSALLGHYGILTKRKIKKLLKHDLVDFVATDSHRLHEDHFIKGYRYVKKKYSPSMANKLFNNSIIIHKA